MFNNLATNIRNHVNRFPVSRDTIIKSLSVISFIFLFYKIFNILFISLIIIFISILIIIIISILDVKNVIFDKKEKEN